MRASADFVRALRGGRRLSHPLMRLDLLRSQAAPDDDAGGGVARLGLAVSRKVDKRAVARNRIKRVLRAGFRGRRAGLPPGDYLFTARPEAAIATAEQLRAAQQVLLDRAIALPPAAGPGTMRGLSPTSSPVSEAGTAVQRRPGRAR